MGEMGYGYGSECHLLRWMGRHRNQFDQSVRESVGCGDARLTWLDGKFKPGAMWPDAEWKGLDFLGESEQLQKHWRTFWPSGRGIHNWDAVGVVDAGAEQKEWLLVEAKGHADELISNCGAKDPASIQTIRSALAETKAYLNVPEAADWMSQYYQYANRLAALHFLHREGIKARLLFIYFVGDLIRGDRNCPQDREGWDAPLQRQQEHLRLPETHELSGRIHKLFLHICRDDHWIM